MQVIKEDIRRAIIKVSTEHFKTHGFIKTSMREIAKDAEVGVGNIYNYFRSKDELFRAVVQPVIAASYAMLDEHHGRFCDAKEHMSPDLIEYNSEAMFQILKKYGNLLDILLFKAQGSSLENFGEEYTENATEVVMTWMERNKPLYPEANFNISRFSVHLSSVFVFTLVRELVMHKLPDDEMRQVLKEFFRMETFGWKELTKV